MFKNTLKRTLVIGIAATFGFAGITACEAPEEGDAPSAEAQEAEAPEAPDEAQQADEPPELEGPGDEAAIDGPEGAEQPPMPMGGDMDDEVSDDDLDKFGEAIEAMQDVHEDGEDPEERMQEAEDPAEQQQIQAELMGEMQSAVEDSGMEFQEFVMMAQRLQQDPELQQRLSERVDMEELMGEPPEGGQQPQPAPGGEQPGGPQPAPAPAEEPPTDLDGDDDGPELPEADDEE